jgi:hypothetical protein
LFAAAGAGIRRRSNHLATSGVPSAAGKYVTSRKAPRVAAKVNFSFDKLTGTFYDARRVGSEKTIHEFQRCARPRVLIRAR